MTARSELFVTEDLRDRIEDKFKIKVEEVRIPDDWYNIYDEAEFPSDGSTIFITKNGKGYKVNWKMEFEIALDGLGGRYIEGYLDYDSLTIEEYPQAIEEMEEE